MLLDLLMPVMSGFETLQAIRKDQALRDLPVMVMSTVREESRVREAIGLGVGTYVTKPLRPAEITERLTRFVSRLGTSGVLSTPPRSCAGLAPGARVLVVDDDRDFRHFVRSTLSPDYSVATASGGAQGLRMAMDTTPGVILLGPQIGPLRAPLFLEKLRAMPRLASVPVIAAMPGRSGSRPAGVDGTIDRTFVAETFRRQFDDLVAESVDDDGGGGSSVGSPGSRASTLRAHLQTAAIQVFGMHLGLQVEVDPSAPPASPGDEVAFVPLGMTRPEADYRILLRAAPDVARTLAARGRPYGEIDDVAIAATLQDLIWMLGSRVLAALRTAGDLGELDAPASTRWTTADPARDGITLAEVGLISTGGDVSCSVLVRAAPRGNGRATRLP
jgi:CheY-like chemotaxis protein